MLSGVAKNFALVILLSSPSAFADAVHVAPQVQLRIQLHAMSEATAPLSRIYVRDIMTCDGYTPLCDEINGVDLGDAPAPGRHVWLLRDSLGEILQQELPDVEVVLAGAQRIKVQTTMNDISGDELREMLVQYVAVAGQGRDDVQIARVQLSRPISVRAGANYRVVGLSDFNLNSEVWVRRALLGMVRVQGEIAREAAPEDRFPFLAMIRLRTVAEVPVPILTIEPGTPLTPELFQLSRVELGASTSTIVRRIEEVVGGVARRRLVSSAAISTSDVVHELMVNRQADVRVHMEKNGLEMTAPGRALQSGRVGDRIAIELQANRKRAFAIVTGKDAVRFVQ